MTRPRAGLFFIAKMVHEEMANPMSLPVPVHYVDSGFRRKNLWRCLKRRWARPRVREITKRSHQVLCFQREHKKRVFTSADCFFCDLVLDSIRRRARRRLRGYCFLLFLRLLSCGTLAHARKCLRFRICLGFAAAWLQPMRPSFTLPLLFERNSIPSPKFVQPDCSHGKPNPAQMFCSQ